ncbi:LysR family transcriptional regulator [Kineosporia sp. NBRC 101731]|uniref:LysR family transcriptional regulator n=1 Tax=Kineosporia sp. NBRC 101731 TaxID=3032199 RepID=UPI0024A45DB2|nr:LysR family transcriptional regulator [Kineosporia sp. NBRC 101731]GLY30747.1 transcriptional regulator [Kineosporia sp. NBRC 101731]
MPVLNLSRLRILYELNRSGTLAEVARVLSYTPSAISQQLSQLEREAGVPLLEKVGRRVRLTDEALTLVKHTQVILEQLELAEAELSAAQPEIHGTLRVASFQTVLLSILPVALSVLAQKHPGMDVEITQREVGPAYEGLLAHEFDLILGEEYPGQPEPIRSGIDREDFTRDALRLALPGEGPHSVRPVRLSDLSEMSWALDPHNSPARRWADALCRRSGFEAKVRFESPDPLLHAHLVRLGHAAAFIPSLVGAAHLEGAQLVSLPGDPHRTLFTAVRSGRSKHRLVEAFRQALAEAARANPVLSPVMELSA